MARSFRSDQRGGVAIMAAGVGGLVCVLTAMSVDLGGAVLKARQIQGAADLSAMAAARDLPRAEAAGMATLRGNLGDGARGKVETGIYTPDRALKPKERFRVAAADQNAARTTVSMESPLYFARWFVGKDSLTITRSATAAARGQPQVAFTLGSRLARLDEGVANQVLSGLTGSQVSLRVADYRGLADADVNLLQFSDALATHLNVRSGDYDALFRQTIDTGEALTVLKSVVGPSQQGTVRKLAQAASGHRLKLGELIDASTVSPSTAHDALNVKMKALDLVQAMIQTGGERQAALDLGANGVLADVKGTLAIGERANQSSWMTLSDSGETVVSTAQARLYLRARTRDSLAGLAQVDVPLVVELAGSQARLNTLACRPERSVELGVRPGVARVTVGAVDETALSNFRTPLKVPDATLLSVAGLARVTAKADVEAADPGFTKTRFSDADIRGLTTKTVTSQHFGQGLISSAIANLDIKVQALGLSLGTGALKPALQTLLAPVGPVLDDLVQPVLSVLGLKLGEADVTVMDAVCPSTHVGLVG